MGRRCDGGADECGTAVRGTSAGGDAKKLRAKTDFVKDPNKIG
jgi:hypothetical protein